SSAFCLSRDAIAATSLHSPFCIPGITLRTAIDAAPNIPHFTFFILFSVAPLLRVLCAPPSVFSVLSLFGSLFSQQAQSSLNSALALPLGLQCTATRPGGIYDRRPSGSLLGPW